LYAAAAAVFLLLILWVSTSVSFNWNAAPETPAASSDGTVSPIEAGSGGGAPLVDYARIDTRLQRLTDQNSMVGLAVGIVEGGRIRFLKGYGITDSVSKQPVTPNTIFRWASLSKGVAGVMVAKLAEQNRLSLYEPAGKYAPSLRLPGGNEQKATISDLLSHRLGLFSHAQDSKLEDGMDPAFLRRSLGGLNAICPPGQCHAYQNVAYDASSEIVAKVTGKSYEQAVREQLFAPLGMRSATMSREALVTSNNWAKPHRGGKTSKPVEVTEPYYRVPAAGGVNSSIKDLTRWMIAQMGAEPDVLSARLLDSVQTPRASTPGELGRMRKFRERLATAAYGLGWRIYDYAGHKVVGHRGGVTGYRSLILFDPERKSGVVALWNSSTNQPGGLEFEIMDMIYRLPPRDWLMLDTPQGKAAAPPPEPEAEANSVAEEPVNGGGA
jgi:beta-lactamase class C